MKYKFKFFGGYILLLFILPMIVANFTSQSGQEKISTYKQYGSYLEQTIIEPDEMNLNKDVFLVQVNDNPEKDVVAEQVKNNPEKDDNKQLEQISNNNDSITINQTEPKKALVLFTHSHEAFIPIVKSENGKTAVYHSNSNIMEFENVIKDHFGLNSINTEFLGVDTMNEMKKTNRKFPEAYNVVRPYLVNQIENNKYDIIIDLHRDSAKRDISTLKYKDETYGKLYFVVGENNPNYSSNKVFAENISTKLNELIPGISRGVIGKKGKHVDGIYNQDLSNNMVLIELGGIENTQDEINRTISVLSRAISIVLQEMPQDNNVISDTSTN